VKSNLEGAKSGTACGPEVGGKNRRTGAVWRPSYERISQNILHMCIMSLTALKVPFPSAKSKVP